MKVLDLFLWFCGRLEFLLSVLYRNGFVRLKETEGAGVEWSEFVVEVNFLVSAFVEFKLLEDFLYSKHCKEI